jgi:hypothetical protein
MNTITPKQKEELIQGLLDIQREELDLTMREWRARGMNRARLRAAKRTYWQRATISTRRLVNEWYTTDERGQ